MPAAVKRNPLKVSNTNLNKSKAFNRSISTYGKVQIRFLNDIPCSTNWLPSDESIVDERTKDIFADVTPESSKNTQLVKPVPRLNLFDSDSEDEFKITSNLNEKSKTRKKLPPKKTATTKRKRKTIKSTKNAESVEKPVNRATLTSCIDNEDQFFDKENVLLSIPVDQVVTSEIQNSISTKSPLVPKENDTSVVRHEQSVDMFATYKTTPQINTELSSKLSNVPSKDAVHGNNIHRRKSILKTQLSAKKLNSTVQSHIDSSINSLRRVSFDSTVVYHAANIEMGDKILPKFSLSSLHKTPTHHLKLSDKCCSVVQSTPLANQLVDRQFTANNLNHSNELDAKKHANIGLELKKLPAEVHKHSPETQQNDSLICETGAATACEDVKKNTVTTVKQKNKKPPVKRRPKKAPVWKKRGGNSFCNKSKIKKKSDNDSILHQIMIGGTVDPKFHFFDDSNDVYFVDSRGEDSLQIKLKAPLSTEQKTDMVNIKPGRAKKRRSPSNKENENNLPKQCKKTSKKKCDVNPKQNIRTQKEEFHQSFSETAACSKVVAEMQVTDVPMRTTRLRKRQKNGNTIKSNSDESPSKKNINLVARSIKSRRVKTRKNYKDIANGTYDFSSRPVQIPDNLNLKSEADSHDHDAFEKDSFIFTNKLEPVAGRTQKKTMETVMISDSKSLFTTSSFTSANHKPSDLSCIDIVSKSSADVTGTSLIEQSDANPPNRSQRQKNKINCKNLSIGKSFPEEKLKHSRNSEISKSDVHAPNKNLSNESSRIVPILNNFICDRNRRNVRKTVPVCLSDNSSLFSTLSLISQKHSNSVNVSNSMTVPMHGFSTIHKSNSEDESHGNIQSDDENIRTEMGAAKRMSTPLVSRSPSRSAQQLFETPDNKCFKAKYNQQNQIQTDKITSLPVADHNMDVFSPITNPSPTHAFPREGELKSPAIPTTITHPRLANLKHQRKTSTPYLKAIITNSLLKPACRGLSRENASNMQIRRHARSPCSHLSSSVIRIDSSFTSLSDEKRRETLDSVKIDLYPVISEKKNAWENHGVNERQNGIRGKLSLSCKVMLTPLRKRFLEKYSPDNRIRLKSLGFVGALSPQPVVKSNGKILTPKEKVLYECDQCAPISFEEALHDVVVESCVKLGEGLYGEVFRCKYIDKEDSVAIKIIPIEGSLIVNSEKQKTCEEILPEIISSKELHLLGNERENATKGFIELFKVTCVKGIYPEFFIQAWDDYDKNCQSENDRPDKFNDEQLHLIFQYADGGTDVEHFKFKSANQAFSVVQQVCAALAVAEKSLQFEHRDLHWGNILVTNTKEKTISTTINSQTHFIKTHGVKASIIDFTLSRLSKGGVTVFQNLAADPDLFTMDTNADYQFEIYQMMKTATKNNWSIFQPKNNIFWLHYLNKKFCKEISFSRRKTNNHKTFSYKLRRLDKEILQYNSCLDAIQSSDLLSICENL